MAFLVLGYQLAFKNIYKYTKFSGQKPVLKPNKDDLILRLAESNNSAYPTSIGDKEFARLVELKSKGKIKVLCYYNSELGDEKSVIDQVQFGGIDLARVDCESLTGINDSLNVLLLPFIFRDSSHLWNVLNGPLGQNLLDSMKQSNIVGLTYYDSGARSFYSKIPITSVSNFKDLKIGIPENKIYKDFICSLGATPVTATTADVYGKFTLDEIDGAENTMFSYFYTKHYYEARYYTVDEHIRTPGILIMNTTALNKLSAQDKELIISAAKDSAVFEKNASDTAEKNAEKEVTDSGIHIIKLDNKSLDNFKKSASVLYDNYKKNYKDIIDKIINTP
jgi:tripartite ATP-independent transporter DctP family solute receptor